MRTTAKTSFMRAVTNTLRAPFCWDLDEAKSEKGLAQYYINSVTGDRKIVQPSVINGILYDLHGPVDMQWLSQSARNGIVDSFHGRKTYTKDDMAEYMARNKDQKHILPTGFSARSAVHTPK